MHVRIAVFAGLLALPIHAQGTLMDQGRAALMRGDADAAADLFEKAVAQSPNNAQAHYWLGSAYGTKAQRSGMFSAAMLAGKTKEQLEKAVTLDPNFLDARYALLEFYDIAPGFMGGSRDKAVEQAQEIRKRDSILGHRAFAFIYSQDKKPELAKKEYADGVLEQPGSPRAHSFYGQYLANTEKNYRAAFDEFDTALKVDPTYMPAYYHIGRTAGLSGAGLARGEESLKKYLVYTPKENEPQAAGAHYWLGVIYEKLGRKDDARQSYTAALKLNPTMKLAQEALKRVS